MTITLCNELREKLPYFEVLAFTCDVDFNESDSELITEIEKEVNDTYSIEELLTIPEISTARKSYKKLGADPNRVHLACESLYRRILKGNHLYQVNKIVDLGNVLSIKAKRSVAVLDLDKISGDVFIRIGTKEDEYSGIGRGRINVNGLPLYCDSISPFGCPTSDIDRTKITENTKSILVMIICFEESLLEDNKKQYLLDLGLSLFKDNANGRNIEIIKR